MNAGVQDGKNRRAAHTGQQGLRLAPVAQAIALALLAGAAAQDAQAQQAFSPAWFASKGATQNSAAATGYLPNGTPAALLTNPAQQRQQANAQLQTSLNNLNLLARGIAAQQAAQEAARQAALANGAGVPDGMAEGGLKIDSNSLTRGWINASAPTQNVANGRTSVAIQQTADKAILNWESFNVGKNTILNFRQEASWALLNRVNDPLGRPSQIQGQINAPGTVMIVNRNGIVFSGSSQVNVRNLVAAAATISDSQFRDKGLYVDADGSLPSLTDAWGRVVVEAGAQMATAAPASATQGGGYVLLLGSEVSNAGQITTPGGQVTLAAGEHFYIRKGVGTDGNGTATTRGNEVSAARSQGSTASGLAINTGLLTASTGDITLTGHTVVQGGVAMASTAVGARGTIHLLNRAGDAEGSVRLAPDSATGIVLDNSPVTALDSQRDAAIQANTGGRASNNVTANFDNLSTLVDRADLSRIEIVSGNTVHFQPGSITLATGGQIAVSARQRSLVADGAVLDVSGAVGVQVAMEANNLRVNIQGNELRDASGNREGALLNNNDVWIDRRSLVRVPAGTNGYASDRWYTAGGLLEVSGYLATGGHSVGEWMAPGGSVVFTGNEVVTQARSSINLSGGTLDVQSGYLNQSWLRGSDGLLYEVSKAPGDLLYTGIYKGFEVQHARWGKSTTEYYNNVLIAPQRRLQEGYTVGRDAGRLVVSTNSAVLEGALVTEVFQGSSQTQAPQAGLDGYKQLQTAAARRGQLVIGQYLPHYDSTAGLLRDSLAPQASEVTLAAQVAAIADGLALDSALPADRQGKIVLDGQRISALSLGGLAMGAKDRIVVDAAVQVANGGAITLFAPQVMINADLTAHGGRIAVGNVFRQAGSNGAEADDRVLAGIGKPTAVRVAAGARLDASGVWRNLRQDATAIGGLPAIDGGSVSLRGMGDVLFDAGAVIDVSSGAALLVNGSTRGGKGGDLTLQSGLYGTAGTRLSIDGRIDAYGVNGGGALNIQADRISIGAGAPAAGTLTLASGFFDRGFSRYQLVGSHGVAVGEGARVDVTMPVYRLSGDLAQYLTGSAIGDVLPLWLPPLYQEDPAKGVLTQRGGASLSLQAGTTESTMADMATTQIAVGKGAAITVDPGQAISIAGIGQMTVEGSLSAWGGKITLGQVALVSSVSDPAEAAGHARSIWIGDDAVLDAAARAATATDSRGRRYGLVRPGGSIVVGGDIDAAAGGANAASLFVVVRPGARLDASGTQAVLDLAGQGATTVASQGGSIALASINGLYLDGTFKASAGGAGAAGGSLGIALETAAYNSNYASNRVLTLRELVVSQRQPADTLPGGDTGGLAYGHGNVSVEQVLAGGFDSLSLLSNGVISFNGDVDLGMRQGVSLYAGGLVLAPGAAGNARVSVAAPYVRLAGLKVAPGRALEITPSLRGGVSQQADAASFTASADLLDVRDEVSFGARGTIAQTRGSLLVDRRGFSQVTLDSSGDLRLLANVDPQLFTRLGTAGLLKLRAAQIYPASGAKTIVSAARIDISRGAALTPEVPYAVFGTLSLEAGIVNQGGVVRAPLGNLSIGRNDAGPDYPPASTEVNLLPGSLTSVSAAGLVMPYGGTVDGQIYSYAGAPLTDSLLKSQPGFVPRGITLQGQSVAVRAGAVIDVSGGGELTGAGFISGRGGSSDARYAPLLQYSANGTFSLPGLDTNPVYAIVPGVQRSYAPAGGERGAVDPAIGRQITIGAGVPGLPAGTYTLLPSTYALLPGAFRVEVNGRVAAGSVAAATPAQALRNGSWAASGIVSTAGTDIRDSRVNQVILTSGPVMRRYAQYNETSLSDFIKTDAARLGVPTILLPQDAKAFDLYLSKDATGRGSFSFAGTLLNAPAPGGHGSTTAIRAIAAPIEVVPQGRAATPGFNGVSLADADLNAIGSASLGIGALASAVYGQGGNYLSFDASGSDIVLRSGALLRAPEVFLAGGALTVEQGAGISTLGRGRAARDASDGYIYSPGAANVLMVSNARVEMLPSTTTATGGGIHIGSCLASCDGVSTLYSEGSIVAATNQAFELTDKARYGTRTLSLAVAAVNAGSAQALQDAAARGVLSGGLGLDQGTLDRLLRGDTSTGAPALENLVIKARDAFNFYGDVTLDTYDVATGQSRLKQLVLGAPAIYGAGDAGSVARIRTAGLVWNGGGTAGTVIAGGAGTGSGTLDIQAERIEFGYPSQAQVDTLLTGERLILGFGQVNLSASERVSANNKGGLSVYQRQGAYVDGQGYTYDGGNLSIVTPLLTGAAGSINRIAAGGELRVTSGARETAAARDALALGAELSLSGARVSLDTTVALPAGKLTVNAQQDVVLGDAARIDMAGRTVVFNDVSKYSWGGDVILSSRAGDIRQAAGAVIDLSATNNQAGSLQATALDAGAGRVELLGAILGASSGSYDAGGTLVPYRAGSIEVHAQSVGDFAALNRRLNSGQVVGSRSFQLKQGDLVIGDEIKAGQVNVSVDSGSLTVTGTIDASGERVGSIRLAARNGLTIAGGALLDAHGTVLRVDSYGKIIDSPNRATIELDSGNGQLTLADGARIDLRHGTGASVGNGAGQYDGANRGTLELNAPRIGSAGGIGDSDAATRGDVAIDARGRLDIRGARSIAINAVRRYDNAPLATLKDANGNDVLGSDGRPVPLLAAGGRPYQVINQAYLDGIHGDSTRFIDAALLNGNLLGGKLAGLNNAAYADVLHLRPGVQITSNAATNPGGDMVVLGDLDLSAYRYASLNPHTVKTGIYGSGESGALTLRAAGDLNIYGSITDGFAPPPATQDDSGWLLTEGMQLYGGDVVLPVAGVVLQPGTVFQAGKVLNYDLPIQATTVAAGTVLPVTATLASGLTLRAGTVLSGAVYNADGSLARAAGTLLTQDLVLGANMRLGAGTRLASDASLAAMTWPAGVALPNKPPASLNAVILDVLVLDSAVTLKLGAVIPSRTDVKLGAAGPVDLRVAAADGTQARNWAVAAMLPAGSQSWSMRLVAGADMAAADTRQVDPRATHGNLRLADTHYGMKAAPGAGGGYVWTEEGVIGFGDPSAVLGQPLDPVALGWPTMCDENPTWCAPVGGSVDLSPAKAGLSVVRTGTGDLELASAGNLSVDSLYGVYTAGAPVAVAAGYDRARGRTGTQVLGDTIGGYEQLVDGGAGSVYHAWYPDRGGNLLLAVGGNLTGDIIGQKLTTTNEVPQWASAAVGNWLWRQGSGTALAAQDTIPTAWWINFGTYVKPAGGSSSTLVGFTGFGTLGGGNIDVRVGGDAGTLVRRGDTQFNTQNTAPRSQALVLAIGSTGRVGADGELLLTGGGDLDLRVGGGINPSLSARNFIDNQGGAQEQTHDLQGALVNLRGSVRVQAGALGGIGAHYGSQALDHDAAEVRAYDPYVASVASATGGMVVVPGDATVSLSTRGDLVLGGAGDAGRVRQQNATDFVSAGMAYAGGGYSWYSLWTSHTAIDLFAAGGNLTPSTQLAETDVSSIASPQTGNNASPTDGRFLYPSILRVVAANGSLYYGPSAVYTPGGGSRRLPTWPVTLAPSASGQLEFLAADSIYAGGYAVNQSGAAASAIATPFAPAFLGMRADGVRVIGNLGSGAVAADPGSGVFPLFAFGADTASAQAVGQGGLAPARFYARDGDIVGLRSGEILRYTTGANAGTSWYEAARPVRMIAGRDIVGSGTAPGQDVASPLGASASGNLFVHGGTDDMSIVSAGRDIVYSSFNVAGPGTLEISAGRHIRMEDKAVVNSIGPVVTGDQRPGAGIVMLAGAGSAAPDYAGFAARYLDPANQAQTGVPLADQAGKVAYVYTSELLRWLAQHYGFEGDAAQALSLFAGLPAQQQAGFIREIYFAELRAGGREYNDADSPRYGSYLRGRQAIATLFPATGADGRGQAGAGDIIMYGNAGVHTLFGGDIQMFAPGGKQIFGVEGVAPASSAGIITQGTGDIQLYAQGSILLGQSRIMTTFGGGITAWSATGDINAGRGAKTTVVYTPPKRVYDRWGDVTLASDVPSTGAGIATLAPIAQVPAGDIDLIAPLGTIDAGEAGIRVSGNVNIAALAVVNAANIQVQGKATGLPVVAAVNVGALTNASAAASSAAMAAQDVVARDRATARQNLPSVFTVRVLGFGGDAASDRSAAPPAAMSQASGRPYDAGSPLQFVGVNGDLDPRQVARLTEDERRRLPSPGR